MVEKDKKLLDRVIIESHCVHPLIGYDIIRIQKEFPEADYIHVSRIMED